MELVISILLPFSVVLSTVFIAVYKVRGERKTSLLLAKENKNLKQEVKDFSDPMVLDLQMFNTIKDAVERMFKETQADRFIIFTACNGKTNMRFATAIYEQHKDSGKVMLSIGAVGKYVRFEFDEVYRKMLKTIEAQGMTTLDVGHMHEGDLKNIYKVEKVKHSLIYFLNRTKINSTKDRLFYCSVATHEPTPFSGQELVVMKTAIDTIKKEVKKDEN